MDQSQSLKMVFKLNTQQQRIFVLFTGEEIPETITYDNEDYGICFNLCIEPFRNSLSVEKNAL